MAGKAGAQDEASIAAMNKNATIFNRIVPSLKKILGRWGEISPPFLRLTMLIIGRPNQRRIMPM